MALSRWAHHAWQELAMAALLWAVAAAVPSIPMSYCSSLNTAASTNANTSIFQSDGLCFNFCLPDFALAVVKGQDCWCSDFIPSKSLQVSTNQCADPCPGFTPDVCGGDGLFGYMSLTKAASGTATAAGGSSTAGGTTTSPTFMTFTTGGTVRTVTVLHIGATDSGDVSSVNHKGLSTGATAGIAVSVVGSVAVALGVIIYLFVKRRQRWRAEERGEFDGNTPRGSSAGMMSTPKTGEASENRYVGGSDGKAMAESWETSTQGKRRSTLMPIDPRMDPIYRAENKSHESVNSLRDDQDYSRRVHEPTRVLRATNPDPDAGD